MSIVKKLLKDEFGATAIEYGLIAAGISVAIIGVVQGLGTKLNSTFTSVQNALELILSPLPCAELEDASVGRPLSLVSYAKLPAFAPGAVGGNSERTCNRGDDCSLAIIE